MRDRPSFTHEVPRAAMFRNTILSGSVAATIVLFFVALAIRLIGAGVAPIKFDELYHILSARSWIENGSFAIADGFYTRVRGYTVVTALSMEIFGDTPLGARLPAVLSGALSVPFLFLLVNREAGRGAAWAAALILCFSAYAIEIAQFARFYAIHALTFWIMAAALFCAADERRSRAVRGANAMTAVIFAMISTYLQVTTLIGLIGLAPWIAIELSRRRGHWMPLLRNPFMVAAAGATVVGVLAGLYVFRAAIMEMTSEYRHASLWAAHRQNDLGYYHHYLADRMAILWYMLPVATLAAWRGAPRFTVFCATFIVLALALHSFAGMKSERYIFYVLPFMAAVWGAALGRLIPQLLQLSDAVFTASARWRSWANPLSRLVAIGCVGVATAGNAMFMDTVKMLGGQVHLLLNAPRTLFGPAADPDWTSHRSALEGSVLPNGPLVTTEDLRTLYYLGHYDILLNRSMLDEIRGREDFSLDRKTGKPVIGGLAALRHVVACWPEGQLLFIPQQWQGGPAVDDATRDYVTKTMRLQFADGNMLFRWTNAHSDAAEACDDLPTLNRRSVGVEQNDRRD